MVEVLADADSLKVDNAALAAVQATAAGNILTQALGLRLIGSLDDARAVVRRSFELTSHEPAKSSLADARYAYFKTLVGR